MKESCGAEIRHCPDSFTRDSVWEICEDSARDKTPEASRDATGTAEMLTSAVFSPAGEESVRVGRLAVS